MRTKARIPIVMDLIMNPDLKCLARFLNIENDRKFLVHLYSFRKEIEDFWNKNPDLRFGQMLCNLGLIPSRDIENYIWNIEETTWLVQRKICNFEDISFWGINYFKNNKPRKHVKYVLLKDLKTDHIENIIKFFGEKIAMINPNYLNYFKTRIEQNGEKR